MKFRLGHYGTGGRKIVRSLLKEEEWRVVDRHISGRLMGRCEAGRQIEVDAHRSPYEPIVDEADRFLATRDPVALLAEEVLSCSP
jgi:hypothetical protein